MGKGSSPKVYQSPYSGQTDDIGFQTMLGMMTGQGVNPSPALNSSIIAQQLGGQYDNKTGIIKMQDGSAIKYDPLSGQFQQQGGGADYSKYNQYYSSDPTQAGNQHQMGHMTVANGQFQSAQDMQNAIANGGQVYDANGKAVSFSGSSPYTERANQSAADLQTNVFNNPSSSFNLFNSYGSKTYNPTTGQYEDFGGAGADGSSTPPDQRTSDYYLNNYGNYLNQGFQGPSYSEYQAYNPTNYQSPTIKGVDNVSQAAKENEYQSGADTIEQNYRDKAQANEDWTARQGGSLSSGRAARMNNDTQQQKDMDLNKLRRSTDQEYELRNYNDASHVRDMQASQDMDVQKLQGLENQYGYQAGAKSHDTAYQNAMDAAKYGYESGQNRGKERMGIASAADTDAYNRAFQGQQADRQQKAIQMSALLDMLRVYGGEDSTAVQLAAAQSQAMGSALGGLFSGIGSAAGGFAGK